MHHHSAITPFGLMLGQCRQIGNLFGVVQNTRRNAGGTNRQRSAWEEPHHTMAIFGMDTTSPARTFIKKCKGLVGKLTGNTFTALVPIAALKQNQEIIATHMADKITLHIAVG